MNLLEPTAGKATVLGSIRAGSLTRRSAQIGYV